MHRELPDYVERMLQAPNAEETHSLVRHCNISDKKWNIFCCALGGALKKRKQKDIAVDYGMSAARVSIIVKDVLTQLTRVVEEPDAPDVVRAYRKSRFAALKKRMVANAGTIWNITKLFSSDRYDKRHVNVHLDWQYNVDFIANGENLTITGRSRLSVSCGNFESLIYTIFWSVKDNNGSRALSASKLFNEGFKEEISYFAVRNSILVIDFNENFWVVDRYTILDDLKHLVIHLKPAVVALAAPAHLRMHDEPPV